MKLVAYRGGPQSIGDTMYGELVHTEHFAKLFYNGQVKKQAWRKKKQQCKVPAMNRDKPRPFADIAERLKWHREVIEEKTQAEYAESIGVNRPPYSLWEAGSHRLSLDGALAIRKKYDLSLDFLYEGMDDALPMTLRKAWRERP